MANDGKIGFLFDLDGVLIDSETEYTRIWTAIAREFYRTPEGEIPDDDHARDVALRIKGQTLAHILEDFPDPAVRTEVTEMLDMLEQRMRYCWLPGAREFLEQITHSDFDAVLVTSSNSVKMKHLREELPELESYFKAMVCAESIKHSKPDPEGYLLGGVTGTVCAERLEEYSDMIVSSLTEINLDELIKNLRSR